LDTTNLNRNINGMLCCVVYVMDTIVGVPWDIRYAIIP